MIMMVVNMTVLMVACTEGPTCPQDLGILPRETWPVLVQTRDHHVVPHIETCNHILQHPFNISKQWDSIVIFPGLNIYQSLLCVKRQCKKNRRISTV